MRVNFELDWTSVGIGVALTWLTFRVQKIFRLWKIKEDGGTVGQDGEYAKVVQDLLPDASLTVRRVMTQIEKAIAAPRS